MAVATYISPNSASLVLCSTAPTPLPSFAVLRLLFALSEFVQTGLDLRLVAAVGRLIILRVRRDVLLIHPAAFKIMRILITHAVAEYLLRPFVLLVAQVQRHRQRA